MVKIILIALTIFLLPVEAAFLPIGPGPVSREEVIAVKDYFPEVLGTNLEGKETLLPDELKGDMNLLVVAFARKQQEKIDTWIKTTENFHNKYPGFEFYELPVIKPMNFFMRFNINNGMRYGIDDKEQRIRTITFYINKKSFKKALDIPNEEEIRIFLINKEGKILWRNYGEATADKIESLELQLNKK